MPQDTLEYKGQLITLDLSKKSEIMERWVKHAERQIVGQPRLIDVGGEMLEESLLRLSDPEQPLGSIIMPGPSGVGKTLLPKVFADFLLHNPKGLTRIDGQDYSQEHMVARITGAPLGYRNHETDPIFSQWNIDQFAWRAKFREYYGNLTLEQKRQNNILFAKRNILREKLETLQILEDDESPAPNIPQQEPTETLDSINQKITELGYPWYEPENETYFSIILVDEIGRGHRDLHNLMFKILDEGRYVSAREQTTNFRNSFIFITDNAGSREIAERLQRKSGGSVQLGFQGNKSQKGNEGDLDKEIYDISTRALKKVFQVEFLNRADHIVAARPLYRESFFRIFDIQISELHAHLEKQKCPLVLKIDGAVKELVVNESLDKPEENARILKRKIKKYITRNLRRLRVSEQIKSGDVLVVTLDPEFSKEVIFKKILKNGTGKKTLTLPSN
ncbi:MAG: ATP-dependent Clp protease ATP-binding subunit [Parcubacteria group bacterium]|nr:ATP-dependent Clp protease ATP-binding subunit [Parcubacteria group bacterium]